MRDVPGDSGPDRQGRADPLLRKHVACYRAYNDRRAALERGAAPPDEPIPFVCECTDAGCVHAVALTLADLDAAHAEPGAYAVLPWHVMPDYSMVHREMRTHWVVEPLPL